MTSKDDLPEVTILCEDIDQERFIREYLICRGWSDRKIKNFGNVKGRTKNIAVAKAIRTQELEDDPSRYAKNQIGEDIYSSGLLAKTNTVQFC
jgi:hypothetical protein